MIFRRKKVLNNSLNISIVVPVFNEAQSIEAFVEQLITASNHVARRWNARITIVFVDDGSRDGSSNIIQRLEFGVHQSRLIVMSRNFGKEAALTAAMFKIELCDAVIMMDADLQHPPAQMDLLIEKWQETGADSVYYYKFNRRFQEGLIKTSVAKLFYSIMNFGARVEITPDAGDYRLINQNFLNALKNLPENQRFMKGLYSWVGFKQIGLPFEPGKRELGSSSFTMFKLFLLALDGFTSFTTAPLRLMMLFGFLVSGISALYGLYIIVEALFFPGVAPGVASVIALVTLFGGLQLLCIGILGEYIGCTLHESKRRPAFIIRDDITLPSYKPTRLDHENMRV